MPSDVRIALQEDPQTRHVRRAAVARLAFDDDSPGHLKTNGRGNRHVVDVGVADLERHDAGPAAGARHEEIGSGRHAGNVEGSIGPGLIAGNHEARIGGPRDRQDLRLHDRLPGRRFGDDAANVPGADRSCRDRDVDPVNASSGSKIDRRGAVHLRRAGIIHGHLRFFDHLAGGQRSTSHQRR